MPDGHREAVGKGLKESEEKESLSCSGRILVSHTVVMGKAENESGDLAKDISRQNAEGATCFSLAGYKKM